MYFFYEDLHLSKICSIAHAHPNKINSEIRQNINETIENNLKYR